MILPSHPVPLSALAARMLRAKFMLNYSSYNQPLGSVCLLCSLYDFLFLLIIFISPFLLQAVSSLFWKEARYKQINDKERKK